MSVKRGEKSSRGGGADGANAELAKPLDASMSFEATTEPADEPEFEVEAKIRRPDEPRRIDLFLGGFERFTRMAASLGVAAAALIAAYQYTNSISEQASARSMEFVRQWQTLGVDKEFVQVQKFVEKRIKEAPPINKDVSEEQKRAQMYDAARLWLLKHRIDPNPDKIDVEEHLDKLTTFFSQVEICSEAKICDEVLLTRYFSSEARSFWSYFSAYADLRRDAGYGRYGTLVGDLVVRFDRVCLENKDVCK